MSCVSDSSGVFLSSIEYMGLFERWIRQGLVIFEDVHKHYIYMFVEKTTRPSDLYISTIVRCFVMFLTLMLQTH